MENHQFLKFIILAICCTIIIGVGDSFGQMEIDWVFVKGGTFQMGDQLGDGWCNETPAHEVTISDFYIGKYEVTFTQYDAFCDATGRIKPDDIDWGRGNRPVINVSWDDARAFCYWMTTQNGHTIRLPSEGEWEYAAREGGRGIRFGNGENIADPKGINFTGTDFDKTRYWVGGVYRKTTMPVGSYGPNASGLYDMSGNVYEWCSDWFDSHYYEKCRYGKCPDHNPQGPSLGTRRIFRGGCYASLPKYLRCANRQSATPAWKYKNLGFRCVMIK